MAPPTGDEKDQTEAFMQITKISTCFHYHATNINERILAFPCQAYNSCSRYSLLSTLPISQRNGGHKEVDEGRKRPQSDFYPFILVKVFSSNSPEAEGK